MLVFWVAAAILSLVAAAMVVVGARKAARAPAEADPTLGLYQRQLAEIDDLVDRGLLDPTERRTAHAEAGRRLLAAADGEGGSAAAGRFDRTAAICLAAALPAVALAVYMVIGAPGLSDQPFGKRVEEWRATDPSSLDPQKLAAVLKTILRDRPGDVEGLRFLAQAQIASDEAFEATANLRKAIALAPQRADLWQMLGSAIMAENDGNIVPDAEEAFKQALRRDPTLPGPRYFLGRARIEAGAPEEGLALWRALLAELPEDMPARGGLVADIAAVERTGRIPQRQAAPAAETPEMQAAVRSMVDGLAARLAQNPDDPEGWIRLVRAYTVLGETDKRDAALATARARYKDRPQVMAGLAQALEAPQ